MVCNVGDNESVLDMTKKVLERYGQIDILMTNAAVQPPGGIATIQLRHWELEFRVNVHGAFYCIRAALPAMIERKSGNIINVSSIGALGGSHYGATKRAVEAMTIGLANEMRGNGIAVNCMKPVRGIDTPGVRYPRARGQVGGPDSRPQGPRTPPDSYVEAAILLAMQSPDKFTGQVLHDAQLIDQLADEETKQRFRGMNPPEWVAAMKG